MPTANFCTEILNLFFPVIGKYLPGNFCKVQSTRDFNMALQVKHIRLVHRL